MSGSTLKRSMVFGYVPSFIQLRSSLQVYIYSSFKSSVSYIYLYDIVTLFNRCIYSVIPPSEITINWNQRIWSSFTTPRWECLSLRDSHHPSVYTFAPPLYLRFGLVYWIYRAQVSRDLGTCCLHLGTYLFGWMIISFRVRLVWGALLILSLTIT